MSRQKMRRDLHLLEQVMQHSELIERWYNTVAIKFMHTRIFKNNEEKLLEEVTNFFLDNLKNVELEADEIEKELTSL